MDMSEQVRLLALPYTLGHKPASTLISVSLVVFGAIPLAYRSLNFALNYPGLSEVIAVSLVGTLSYGIWSSRSMARTSQSSVVSKALMERVYAREEAVLLSMQESAVYRVTKGVLALYEHYRPSSSIKPMPPLPVTTCDLIDVANDLGILTKTTTNDKESVWESVSWEDALARLK